MQLIRQQVEFQDHHERSTSCEFSIVEILPPEIFVDVDELSHLDDISNHPSNRQKLQEFIIDRSIENMSHRPPVVKRLLRRSLSFMDIEKPAYFMHSTVSLLNRYVLMMKG